MHPPTYWGLSFQAEMLSILRAGIWPVCFWWLEWLEAESAWLEHAPFAFWIVDTLGPRSLVELGTSDRGVVLFHNNNEQAAELTAIRRRDVQAEAACAA
jgi:hypothetical protein